MKKITNHLFSLSTMGALLIILSIAMALATFIESSHGTTAARALIYRAWWFESILALAGISMLFNLFKKKYFGHKKWTIAIFHAAFILMIVGAGITRYFGFEGVMHIRQGETKNTFQSRESYFAVTSEDKHIEKEVLFSRLTSNEVNLKLNDLQIKSIDYYSNAVEKLVESDQGKPTVELVFGGHEGMRVHQLNPTQYLGDTLCFDFQLPGFKNLFSIKTLGKQLFLQSKFELTSAPMGQESDQKYPANTLISAQKQRLYALSGMPFMVRNFFPKAKLDYMPGSGREKGLEVIVLEVTNGSIKKLVRIPRGKHKLNIANKQVELFWGQKEITLPFSLKLDEFKLQRNPGSHTPSSFESFVSLIDTKKGVNEKKHIFMNNVLAYDGYRFYQSSYDQDELGTILSVNNDWWGAFVTYISYAFLFIAMLLALFAKKSRFQHLFRQINKFTMKAVVLALLLGTSIVGQAQSAPKFPKSQAHRFSQLWGQGTDGRYEPVETLNNELLRKLYRKNKYKQQTSTQVILGMLLYPTQWQKEPIIKIKSELALKYGFKDNFISYSDMFSSDGKYKIEREAQAAYSKAPAERGRFEKDIIDLDEKINISYSIYTGSFLRIIPSSKDNHKWLVPGEIKDDAQSGKHKIMLQAFLHSIQKGNLTDADNVLSEFEELQNSWEHIPSATKKKMELIYNKYNIFKSLFPFFLTLSIVLLFIVFINIIRGVPTSNKVLITINSLLFIGFLAHTVGLIMRWYIAGHAPWSNGYESMIYIAWSSMLAGLLFARKNPIVVGVASLMTGLTLLVAHLNWLNPEITLLVPVLKSYWLMLHVAIITASYGFLGISFFLSVFNFTLWNFKNENRKQISRLITQLTMISEMFITIGIYFLTIGIFIGGIWANESWGRYWGWDPKETWSLITLLIYAFVLHMRFIPGLRGKFAFNLGALLSFGMVIMTYFGVNYFLSGLHSYASADAFTVPKWVYISLVLVVSLVISAYIKQREEDSILKQ